jgi:hypothetical protein
LIFVNEDLTRVFQNAIELSSQSLRRSPVEIIS